MKTYVFPVLLFFLVSCTPANNNVKESNSATDPAAAENKVSPSTGAAANKAKSNGLPEPIDTTILLVKNYLQTFYKKELASGMLDSADRKFCMYKMDLNSDNNNEVFVGLRGPYFCGSGGCTIILLNAGGKAITLFTVTEPPVVIAKSTTKGWSDLVLFSGRKNRHVKFNGKTYPSNPSVLPEYAFAIDDLITGLDYTRVEWISF